MRSPVLTRAALTAVIAALAGHAAARTLAITHVGVVDIEAGRVVPDVTVLVGGEQIVQVGARVSVPRGAWRVDGRGHYLIPGLWDMHTHHQASGVPSFALFVANGVTGTRDMGSDASFILPLRERVARGELLGPEIVAAGPILDAAPADWPWRRRVTNAAQGAAAVRDLKAAGVDFVKVHDNTPRDAYFAIAREASVQGLPFAGHVPGAISVQEAANAGQASIEHLANFRVVAECSGGVAYDAAKCGPLFDLIARNRVWQTPTLAFFMNATEMLSGRLPPAAEYASPGLLKLWRDNTEASALSEDAKRTLQALGASALEAIPDMRKRGVRFLAGCDGLVPGFCLHDELEWMTKAGMSPAEALRTATTGPAEFLGRSATLGAVKPGYRADLVLLERNPLEDIHNTRKIAAVVVRGRLIQAADRNRLLRGVPRACDAARDQGARLPTTGSSPC